MATSLSYTWHRRPGLLLAIRYVRSHRVEVVQETLAELPRLSPRMIRLALWLFPRFLDRADLTFPIIVAGQGWYQIALDGRHRISKAIWTGVTHLPTVRVPWWYSLELLFPGVYEVEWLVLFLRKELRRSGRHGRAPMHALGTAPPAPGSPAKPEIPGRSTKTK